MGVPTPVLVTMMLPVVPAPTTALIVVAFTIVNELAAVPPKVTPVTPVKLVPRKVTISPVPAKLGEKLVNVCCWEKKLKFLLTTKLTQLFQLKKFDLLANWKLEY